MKKEKQTKIFLKLYFKKGNRIPCVTIEIDEEDCLNKLMALINDRNNDYVAIGDFGFKRENLDNVVVKRK